MRRYSKFSRYYVDKEYNYRFLNVKIEAIASIFLVWKKVKIFAMNWKEGMI